MKEYIYACSVTSAGDSDQGCGHFFLLNWQIRAVTYALQGGILATRSGIGCISTCMGIDLKGKLAWHKAVIIKTADHLSADNEISASYYNIPRWWMDLKACSFTCLLFFFLLNRLCSLSSSSSWNVWIWVITTEPLGMWAVFEVN